MPKKHGKMWQKGALKYGKMLQRTLYNSRILLQEVLKYERTLVGGEYSLYTLDLSALNDI